MAGTSKTYLHSSESPGNLFADDLRREQAMLGSYIESIANYKRIFQILDK